MAMGWHWGPIWELIACVACLSGALRNMYRDSVSERTYSLLGWISLACLIVTIAGHIIVRRRIKRAIDWRQDLQKQMIKRT